MCLTHDAAGRPTCCPFADLTESVCVKLIQNRSLGTKLSLILALGIVGAVLLASLTSSWREAHRRLETKRDELNGIAAAIATTASAPVFSGDRAAITRALKSIGRIPGINFARISDRSGHILAELGLGIVLRRFPEEFDPQAQLTPLSIFTVRHQVIDVPVIHSGEQLATLRIIADIAPLRHALIQGVLNALLAGLAAALFGVILTRPLLERIIEPVQSLKEAMVDVTKTGDYRREVPRTSNDEMGILVDAFNEMLLQIRTRDDALAEHRRNLEQTVAERTRELSDAKVTAEEANVAKSEFLATMSHEIRTPLNGMLVTAELLTRSDLPDRIRRHVEIVNETGHNLLAIINDILDLSKIEAGRLELDPVSFSPRSAVEGTLRIFAMRAEQKGLHLTSKIAPNVPEWIEADQLRLAQILSNLVNNAIKFTEAGSITVTLDVPPDEGKGRNRKMLRFSVKDSGIGIASDRLATIFEPFSQADQSTTRRYGGTGIGLTICRRLALAMGGSITVASQPGVGSTFTFTIAAPKVTKPVNVARPATKPLPQRRFETLRVLAAEDSAVNQEVLQAAFAHFGIVPTCVKNGREALEAFQRSTFDLVLLDGSMPEMDGYTAAKAMRTWERRKKLLATPIIAFTAHVVGDRANRWQEAGMSDCLTKPYTLASLGACIDRWAPDQAASTESSSSSPSSSFSMQPVPYTSTAERVTPDVPDEPLLPVLDEQVIREIAQMQTPGSDLLERVTILFRECAPSALSALANTVATGGSGEDIAAAAHALKSMSRNVGAERLAAMCDRIEGEAREYARLPTPVDVERLDCELQFAVEALEDVRLKRAGDLHATNARSRIASRA